jgi:hypothetical protein
MRVIITGNSGSGKTWLATHPAEIYHCQVIHRDHFSVKRSSEIVEQMIVDAKNEESWIVKASSVNWPKIHGPSRLFSLARYRLAYLPGSLTATEFRVQWSYGMGGIRTGPARDS